MTGALDGTVAVVTGTSPNIGAGIAIALGEAGADVACVDVNLQMAELCAAEIRAGGRRAIAIECSVTDEDAVEAAFARVAEELGPVSALVNAAGVFNHKGIYDMPLDEWRRQLEVILTGAFLCTRAAVRAMRAGGVRGSVVNVTSSAAHQGEPGNVTYATGKGGLLNFTRAVAMDVAGDGIRVNSLTPTATDPREGIERARKWGVRDGGPWEDDAQVDAFLDDVTKKVPLRVLPVPADYGRAIVFLLSDAARMITGADLKVDSGTLAKYWRWDPA